MESKIEPVELLLICFIIIGAMYVMYVYLGITTLKPILGATVTGLLLVIIGLLALYSGLKWLFKENQVKIL